MLALVLGEIILLTGCGGGSGSSPVASPTLAPSPTPTPAPTTYRFSQVTLSLDTQDMPRGIAFADFDRDGRNDVVIANNGSNSLSLFLQRADGTFGFARKLVAGREPIEVCVLDANRDGQPDLLSSNFAVGELTLFIATGAGTFNPAVEIRLSPTAVAYGLACADLDNNGTTDAVVTSFSESASYLLQFDPSAPTTPTISSLPSGDAPVKAALRDFDGDGLIDLFIVNRNSDDTTVLRNTGSGRFAPFQTLPTGVLPFGADAFAIGSTEYLAIATTTGRTIDLYSRLPSGLYGNRVQLPSGTTSARSIIAIDRDFDGDLDLIAVNSADNSIGTFDFNGAVFGAVALTPVQGGPPRLIEKFDINGDGLRDYAIVSQNSVVTLYLTEAVR